MKFLSVYCSKYPFLYLVLNLKWAWPRHRGGKNCQYALQILVLHKYTSLN